LAYYADKFKNDIPTKEEVAEVEETVNGWVARAEKIEQDATPAAKNA